MFKFQFSGNMAGKYSLAVNNLDNLTAALRQFSKYLREKTKQRFAQEGPGWPGLAKSTEEKLTKSFTGKFTVHGKLRKTSLGNIRASIERGIRKGKISVAARSKFNQIVAGNLHNDNLALKAFGFFERKKKAKEMNAAEKIEAKLDKLAKKSRAARAESLSKSRAIGKHRLLGKLASTIKSSIKGSTLEVYSSVDWAGVHNDGGSAGHGSRIPARTFLELEEKDLEVLVTIVEGQIIKEI